MEFWLLDLNYERYDEKPAILLWGITPDNKRVVIVREYEPYFFVVAKDSQNPADLKNRMDIKKPHPGIKTTVLEKKRLLGVERTVIRVSCSEVDSIEKCARQTVKFLGAQASYEETMRPASKYQKDHDLKPCQWFSVEVERVMNPHNLQVDAVYRGKSDPERLSKAQSPALNLTSFAILTVSKLGSPRPERDPVQEIAWSSATAGNSSHASGSEPEMIRKFSESISQAQADFIFCFDGKRFNWPYLIDRAARAGTVLRVGRDGGPPHQSLYGHFSITGRANVDLANFADDLYDVRDKSLGNVLRYLRVSPREVELIDQNNWYRYWSDPELRGKLEARIEADAEDTLELGRDTLDYIVELSALCGLPPDQVLAAAVGFRVDNYMMMEASKLGELIPSRNELPVIPYRGAIVLKPAVGLHDNIAVADFSSMYPSLMVKYNISPDTITEDAGEDTFVVPEVRWKFRQKTPGLYATALKRLLDERRRLKLEVARSRKGTREYRLLKSRERAVKVITNATYGYAGWAGSRWYSKQVAESAAALGRDTITRAIAIAKRLGLKVLYGDTDSLFLANDTVLVEKFLASVEEELGLEISLGQVYKRVLFTEAMKKYAGLREDGEIDVVGMEAIRGDWSQLAKDVQNEVLRMVLEDKGPARAKEYVLGLTKDLKSAKKLVSSFIIWKTLTKRPEEYDVHAPHVEVAKRLVKEGWKVGSGDRVGFVIVNRPGKLFQKAEPYFDASLEELDYDYYVQNQILPVAARALSAFGISEKELVHDESLG